MGLAAHGVPHCSGWTVTVPGWKEDKAAGAGTGTAPWPDPDRAHKTPMTSTGTTSRAPSR
jgi:hypothetical protein